MRDVVNRAVKPRTRGTGVGLALLLNAKKPLRAKVMVSHAWDETYYEFVKALVDSGNTGPFWVCALSIYQNEDLPGVTISDQLGPDPHYGPFATVLRQAELMIAIVTNACNIYSRMWCVFEMYIALNLKIEVRVATYAESEARSRGQFDGYAVLSKNPLFDQC